MKHLTTTTPGNLFNLEGILTEVDDCSGTFWAKADSILESVSDRGAEIKESPTNWSDLMMNKRNGKIYAIWATDELTCTNGILQYIELDEDDCPEAFEMSKDKLIEEQTSLLIAPGRATGYGIKTTISMLSNKWNMTDNVYVQSRMHFAISSISVDPAIVEFAKTHNRKDTLLYNNRVFFGYINPSQQRKNEYDANRTWILNYFN